MSRQQPSTDIDLHLQFGDSEEPPHRPVDDQRAVMASYFDGTGRVVVDASAGTGKTSTLVVTLAETIVRTATSDWNPLSDILVTTFGRDATAELKTRLKELLRHHVDAGGDLPTDVFRWIETDSYIQTLDSFFVDLLREIAIEVGVPPDFTVDDQLELQEIREGIITQLRREYRSEFRTLTQAYPDEEWREYPPDSVEAMLIEAHRNCREFGLSTTEAADSLRESLIKGHGGESNDGPESVPPETVGDITKLLRAVVDPEAELSYDDPADAQQLLEHVRETYFNTEAAIDAFGTLLAAFEQAYDRRTKRAGQFAFTDVAHLLNEYISSCESTHPFRRTLRQRFDRVFVDEFQDTSTVQCTVLRRLIGEEVDCFVIGDTKQAIYEWRSADPALFAEIVAAAKTAAPEPASVPHLDISHVRYHALTTVFRHHPDIAAAANHVFQRLLEDEGRGAIGEYEPSYAPVEPYGEPWDVGADDDPTVDDSDDQAVDSDSDERDESAHIHVLDVASATGKELTKYLGKETWATAEATRIAETIRTITDPDVDEPPVTIRERDETGAPTERQPTAGDITLLFRSTRTMKQYATVLREEYGIAAETTASGDLFDQSEISLLIDILSWIARPYADRSLRRLLRSPLVALSDETIRTIIATESGLPTLVDSWPDGLPVDDRQRLGDFLALREDLRWSREQSKTALVHRLLRHSGFDGLVLSDTDALRRHGNIWLFIEIIDDWEVDELLSYREFLRRLQLLRSDADGADPQFSEADVIDHETGDAVTLTTVHGAKGQEYPIVFLCDLIKQSSMPRLQGDRLLASRRHGFALRPRPGSTPSPETVSFPTPDETREPPVWFNDDFDTTSVPDVTGPIWISDARTDSGEFRYPNPLNSHLTALEAEFWRLAYVAFTRAEDHIFLGLGSIADDDEMRWSTWLAAFNETIEPDSGWGSVTDREIEHRTVHQQLSWTQSTGKRISDTVTVGVDEIPSGEPESTEPLDLSDELDQLAGPGERSDHAPYRPLAVSATSLSTLADCPRAFQYRHVQQIETTEKSSQSPAERSMQSTPTPGALAANEWGEMVHRLIERQLTDDGRADQFIQHQPETVETPLRRVLAAVDGSSIVAHAQSAEIADWVAEYDLSALVSTDSGDLRVTGTVDFLYRADDEWHLVDWKTGAQSADGATETHIRQLSVYAWLLRRSVGIEVDTATLAYIDPDGEPVINPVRVTEKLDSEWVDRTVATASESLPITSEDGLETRPDPERCGVCPYAATRGGPCMDDYDQHT